MTDATATITHKTVTLKLCADGVRLYDAIEDACKAVKDKPTAENRSEVQYTLRQYFEHRAKCETCTALAPAPIRKERKA